MHVMVCVCVRGQLVGVRSLYHVDSGAQTMDIKVGTKPLYPRSHLAGSSLGFPPLPCWLLSEPTVFTLGPVSP